MTSYANTEACDFKKMNSNIKSIIDSLNIDNSCIQAKDENEELVGYSIDRNQDTISIMFSSSTYFPLAKIEKNFTLLDLFFSTYSNDDKGSPYVKSQRSIVKKSSLYGFVSKENRLMFFNIKANHGPYINFIAYFYSDNNNKLAYIVSSNSRIITDLILKE